MMIMNDFKYEIKYKYFLIILHAVLFLDLHIEDDYKSTYNQRCMKALIKMDEAKKVYHE